MTAINVVFKKDRVHLLTDGAVYTGEGMPIGFMQKTMAIPPLQAAVAMQGTAFAVGYLAQAWASMFHSFDDMMERGAEHLHYDYLALARHLGGDENVKRFRIFVVGFSDADNKPKGFHFTNLSGEGIFETLNSEPDQWCMVPSLSPQEEDNLESLNILRNGYEFVGRFDPVRHGIPLMEAQRRMPIMPLGSLTEDEVPIVGGNILSTEISATGITQKVIHRWADDRFSTIEPDAFVVPKGVSHPTPPSNLSRQQRRAWERQHGKVAA